MVVGEVAEVVLVDLVPADEAVRVGAGREVGHEVVRDGLVICLRAVPLQDLQGERLLLLGVVHGAGLVERDVGDYEFASLILRANERGCQRD